MYRLTTLQGESYLTEKVNYIRKHDSGVYLLTDANHAEGVFFTFCFYKSRRSILRLVPQIRMKPAE